MEKSSFKQSFYTWLGKYTYRERFIGWSLFILCCLPVPAFWLLEIQNEAISHVDQQLMGLSEASKVFKIYETVVDDYIEWVSGPKDDLSSLVKINSLSYDGITKGLPEFQAIWHQIHTAGSKRSVQDLNALYLEALNLIKQSIKDVVFNAGLLFQNKSWVESLAETIYLRFPIDSYFVADIYAQSVLMGDENQSLLTDSPRTSYGDRGMVVNNIELFRLHVVKTKNILEESYQSIEKVEHIDETIFSNARQELLDIYRWDGRFIDSVNDNLKLAQGQGVIQSKLAAQRVIQNIHETRKGAETLLKALLLNEQSIYTYQRILFILSLLLLLFVIATIAFFHLLTGHFTLIYNYLQGVLKGDFGQPLYMKKHEELGELSIQLKTMGEMVSQYISRTQDLCLRLIDSTSNVAITSYEQARVVSVLQENQRNIEIPSKAIAELSRKLAGEMNVFAEEAKNRLLEDRTEETVSLMHSKLEAVTKSSSHILTTLSKAKDKVLNTNALAAIMTKISEKASILSLNADIEASQVTSNLENFGTIIDKISIFSENALASSVEMSTIAFAMSQSISQGENTADECAHEISNGATRLVLAKLQINRIISQDDMQTGNFLVINQMMQNQAALAEGIAESISSLSSTINDNAAVLYKLYATVAELRKATKELEEVVNWLFDADTLRPLQKALS